MSQFYNTTQSDFDITFYNDMVGHLKDNSSNQSIINCSAFLNFVPDDYTTAVIQAYGPYVVGIFCAIAFLFGIIGNGALIAIILREVEMQETQNVYLFSIALGDFLFILVYTPFTIFIYGFKDWPFNDATCKFITCLQTFSVGLSVFTLTALTCDKYIEVTQPLKTVIPSLRRKIMIASLAWVAAIAFATLDLLAAKLNPMHPYNCSDLVYCGTNPEWGVPYEQFRVVLDFVVFCSIPTIVMLVLYTAMARVLLHNRHPVPQEDPSPLTSFTNRDFNHASANNHNYNNNNGMNAAAERRKQFRRQATSTDDHKRNIGISISLAVLFLLCVLPRQVYLFWFYFDVTESTFNYWWYMFKILGFMTTFVNSCINPIALCIVSKQYRAYFKRYICCVSIIDYKKSRSNRI